MEITEMMYDELDWEDIESMLYSQVYHASTDNQEYVGDTESNTNDAVSLQNKFAICNVTSNTKKYNRYFHTGKDVLRNAPIYISIEQNKNAGPPDSNSVQKNMSSGVDGGNLPVDNCVGHVQNNITINQYNIPLIINPELHETDFNDADKRFLSTTPKRYRKILVRRESRRRKKQAKRIAKRKQNKERRKEKREKREIMNTSENFSSLMVEVNENDERLVNDVICVSDDSNSECIIVQDTELLDQQVSKKISTGFPKKYNENDEHSKKPESDDDIIYIPPPPVEVINVDVYEGREKVEGNTAAKDNQEKNFIECVEVEETEFGHHLTLHTTSDYTQFSKPSPSKTYNPKERKELLGTPESSASNDFLDNANIENNTQKFNFGLHGSDFNSASGDFVRPAKPMEFCETESSCSTNDLNREFNNSVKTIVFDEVEFPRADIFSEKNLESFGSYITPKRNTKASIKNSGSIKSKKLLHTTSSDSSSESDFEPSDHIQTSKDFKKLPILCPMQFGEPSISKKHSKKKTASEFFKEQPTVLYETKKEARKRKSDVVDVSDTDSDSMELPIDKKKKPPKKKQKIVVEETNQLIKKKRANVGESASIEREKKKKPKDSDKPQNKKKKNLSDTVTSSEESDEQANNLSRRKAKKTGVQSENLENEKKKKKYCSDSKNDYKESADIEIAKKKKKKKKSLSLDTKSTSEPEEPENIPATEKVKKKKSISSETDNEETSLEKKLKKRRKSCSTSSNKSLEVTEKVDEYIEVELLDEVDDKCPKINVNGINLQTESQIPLENSIHLQENTIIKENKKNTFDNVFKQTLQRYSTETYSETVNLAIITEASTQEAEQQDSDEEIVVDDEVEYNPSSLIVVDEVNCTTINEEEIKVVSSSDSDCDFKDLANVGKNIELANCSANVDDNNSSDEILVVDDNSQSDSTGPHALRESFAEFDVDSIQRAQTDDPELWKISHKDRMTVLNSDRSKGPRCNRCRQFGHIAIRCTEKRGPPKCSLCGATGHQEPRCTKKICTQCGNEGDYSTSYCWKCFKFRSSICRICNMKGHIAKTCPDLWRRYHLTTEEGPIVVSKEPQLKPRDAQWCSGCAKQGHLEHECNYYNRAYPPTNPCIMSYEDIFYDDTRKLPQEPVPRPPRTIPQSQNLPTISNFGAGTSKIPCLLSLDIPIPFPCQNLSYTPPEASSSTSHIVPPLPPAFDSQAQMVFRGGANYVVELPNRAEMPFQTLLRSTASVDTSINIPRTKKNTVLDKMRLAYLNEVNNAVQVDGQFVDPHKIKEGAKEICRNDQRRIKHIIMSMPCHKVREFLKREMADLDDVATQSDPRYLRKMIFKFDGLAKSKKPLKYEFLREQCFWNRIVNIYIFGVHKYREGGLHITYLQTFLSEPNRSKLDMHKRRSLFSSYNYIFGVHRHNVSYYNFINKIMERSGQNRRKRFS